MKNLFVLAVFLICIAYMACSKKDETKPNVQGDVELFILKDYELGIGTHQINEASVELDDEPLLDYNDFLSYNSSNYTFKILNNKKELFAIDGNTVHFKAFAVVANKQIIYTGFLWPEYSSQSVDWLVVSPIRAEISGELRVQLGYPVSLNNWVNEDKRNDQRILEIFKRDNKLVY